MCWEDIVVFVIADDITDTVSDIILADVKMFALLVILLWKVVVANAAELDDLVVGSWVVSRVVDAGYSKTYKMKSICVNTNVKMYLLMIDMCSLML